jgi:metal-responsive CopG/Arc/MetJ family transcriptional regulator
MLSFTQLNWRLKMPRKTAVLGFSVSPELAKEYQRIAEREGTTKSELFRRMVISYKTEREEEEFLKLQRKMARRARTMGVLTERDVERIVFEDR